jgi:hypothetical protein
MTNKNFMIFQRAVTQYVSICIRKVKVANIIFSPTNLYKKTRKKFGLKMRKILKCLIFLKFLRIQKLKSDLNLSKIDEKIL